MAATFVHILEKDYEIASDSYDFIDTIDYYENRANISPITAKLVEGLLTRSECDKLLVFSQSVGYNLQPHHESFYRTDEKINIHDPEAAQIIFTRILSYLPKNIAYLGRQWELIGLSPFFRFSRMESRGFIKMHRDGNSRDFGNECLAMLSVLIFLNDVDSMMEGGETELFDCEGKSIDKIVPIQGDCIIFSQYEIFHGSAPLNEGAKKYTLKADILYKPISTFV